MMLMIETTMKIKTTTCVSRRINRKFRRRRCATLSWTSWGRDACKLQPTDPLFKNILTWFGRTVSSSIIRKFLERIKPTACLELMDIPCSIMTTLKNISRVTISLLRKLLLLYSCTKNQETQNAHSHLEKWQKILPNNMLWISSHFLTFRSLLAK